MPRLRRRFRALRRAVRRTLRVLWAAPLKIRVGIGLFVLVALSFSVNWAYQVIRKPAELFFPVSGALAKAPAETWRQYAPIFREHATTLITPDFLAALAQVEGAGNPVARTYWRWRMAAEPFNVYRPASSAVGMYQMTDATYREAKRYCIRDHAVAEECWFNSLYLRTVPSHAVEMTSAFLDRRVAEALKRQRIAVATLQQVQDLAAVIHLCGATAGNAYARRNFRLAAGQRCSDHDLRGYLAQLNAMKLVFSRLAEAGSPGSRFDTRGAPLPLLRQG
jgi:transglycosylase-like protein with SLT domain